MLLTEFPFLWFHHGSRLELPDFSTLPIQGNSVPKLLDHLFAVNIFFGQPASSSLKTTVKQTGFERGKEANLRGVAAGSIGTLFPLMKM
jgi:hypothetical protein